MSILRFDDTAAVARRDPHVSSVVAVAGLSGFAAEGNGTATAGFRHPMVESGPYRVLRADVPP